MSIGDNGEKLTRFSATIFAIVLNLVFFMFFHWIFGVSAPIITMREAVRQPHILCAGDEPEAMMQACLQIMAPGDRSSSSAEHEMMAEPPDRVG